MNDDKRQTQNGDGGALVSPIGEIIATTFATAQIIGDVIAITAGAHVIASPGKDLNDVAAGRAILSATGKAEFVPGSAAAPVFEPGKVADEMRMWWEDGAGDKYLIEQGVNEQRTWSTWNGSMLVKLMRSRYVRMKARENETLGECDQVLLYVMQERRVDLALEALPGYRQGIHNYKGKKILVKSSPHLLEPLAGDWPTIKLLIDGRLDLTPQGGPDQSPYFHGWYKIAAESLYVGGPGNFQPGQCCIFAGPADSGKGRLQHQLITGGLGGRSADPGPYLFNKTDFNGEWLEGEHLLMEELPSSTAIKDRVLFGERLKQIVVNDTQRLHAKRETAQILQPFFRVTISVNDDPDKLEALPLLTPDMKDKVHLFLVAKTELPMETSTLVQRAAFRAKIAAELPAYLWWLLHEFEIPAELRKDRFGVKEWLHPSLAQQLFDDTPGAQLLQIIDQARTVNGLSLWQCESRSKTAAWWDDTAIKLEQWLMESTLSREAERLLRRQKIGKLLGRLASDEPDRVIPHRPNGAGPRLWMISEVTD